MGEEESSDSEKFILYELLEYFVRKQEPELIVSYWKEYMIVVLTICDKANMLTEHFCCVNEMRNPDWLFRKTDWNV